MDILLDIFADYVLDSAWAELVPASAFIPATNASSLNNAALNTTVYIPSASSSSLSSAWSHLVLYLPHPPFPAETLAEPTLSTILSTSAWPRD